MNAHILMASTITFESDVAALLAAAEKIHMEALSHALFDKRTARSRHPEVGFEGGDSPKAGCSFNATAHRSEDKAVLPRGKEPSHVRANRQRRSRARLVPTCNT